MNVALVDPSLFTAPYDAALTRGLLAAGVQPTWMTRPVRRGDRAEIPPERTDAFFYRRTDEAAWLPAALRPAAKGLAHLAGTLRLLWKIHRLNPEVVHFQWTVVPLIDAVALAVLRRWCPVIFTVHDSVAYNGQRMSWLQRLGHELPAKLADRVIVHTRAGRETLRRRGVADGRVCVIAHPPLALPVAPRAPAARDPRWTVALFGEIKPYKGLDVLIEAVAALPEDARGRLRVIVAGRPRMDVAPLLARLAALRLEPQFELRLRRLDDAEMAALFGEADAFVFPYRQIDASGVYYLARPLGKWLIASRVGVFAEELAAEAGAKAGALVPPGDPAALARALGESIALRPRGRADPSGGACADIGRATRSLYEEARAEFDARRAARPAGAWRG